jgi:dTDP-4-dehydrorhamnose 3,5-epimerase-like enzyme
VIFTRRRCGRLHDRPDADLEDERGFFARSYCAEEFAAHGLLGRSMPQCSVSFNARAAPCAACIYQAQPHAEDKLVRCTAGAIFDVIVDLRGIADASALVRIRI